MDDFTNRNTTFMTWNLLHLARMMKDAGGIPAHGNQPSAWDAGCRFDFANPYTDDSGDGEPLTEQPRDVGSRMHALQAESASARRHEVA